MDRQKIFEQVREHLLRQQEKSEDSEGRCLYRGPGNRRCALGCLVPDELYDIKMENGDAVSLLSGFDHHGRSPAWTAPLRAHLGMTEQYEPDPNNLGDENFLNALQVVHDEKPVSMWEKELHCLALDWRLQP